MISRSIALLAMAMVGTAVAAGPDAGWPAYGGDAGGTRYSTLSQINRDDVKDLRVAWIFHTGELGQGVKDWDRSAFEVTPILYDGVLYFTTPSTNVVAIDATTGSLRWRYDSHNRNELHYSDGVSRGVSLWVDEASPASAPCHARIYAPTLDSRLLALDAATGKLCEDFGKHGAVNLLEDVRSQFQEGDQWRDYLVTSPPAIIDGKVVVGSSIGDNRSVLEELGTVRAFDARSGKLVWNWDPIPRDASNPVYKEWDPGKVANASAANAWAPLSVDLARHLVYVPTGSASPDFFGGERPGDNRWANSLVALDAATGKLVWGYQLVHHDLWDYDLASQPALVDLIHDGKHVDAVIQATKTGFLYTFDRQTGVPLFPITEKAVPQDAVPGERPSPTQPYPSAPPALVRQGPVTPDDAWSGAFFNTDACKQMIKADRSEGIFQPPSTKESIMQPGNAGGSNWGSIAFDPQHQIAIADTMDLAFQVALIPSDQLVKEEDDPQYDDWEFGRQRGTPYAMRRRVFKGPHMDTPCLTPPWGRLTAVDMQHGTIKWQIPLGDAPMLGGLLHFNLGMPVIGGPMITAGGLVFIAASLKDDRLRAFDLETGKLLWDDKLPAGGQATPMTYSISGRQFVVIAAGGYKGDTTRGDTVIAYALPQ